MGKTILKLKNVCKCNVGIKFYCRKYRWVFYEFKRYLQIIQYEIKYNFTGFQ